MPLIQMFFKGDRPESFRRAVSESVHRAMVEAYSAPESGKFQVFTQAKDDDLFFDAQYAGVQRSGNFIFIQLTAANTRNTDQKQAFFKRAVELLGQDPGIRSDDIVIEIVENAKENWFFGVRSER
jgi:phenylpyruvate tautomerase PptA (4-oxalocrotonate tautomerase family)